MFPPFPQELARFYCMQLVSRLEDGSASLVRVSRPGEGREGQGVMLGALVCWDPAQERRVVLYALSGNAMRLQVPSDFPGIIVPPLVSGSQIEKVLAEHDGQIHELTRRIRAGETELKKRRSELTDTSLRRVFAQYEFTSFSGATVSLNQLIAAHGGRLPPAGTGDCCAPRLLSYAFSHGLEPVSMDEVFYKKATTHKKSPVSYPPCDGRCGYILPEILGLELLYRDSAIAVVNKPSGLLSIPGRGAEKSDCVESRLKKLFPRCIGQPAVHRLDMETSGILVLALTKEAHHALRVQFEQQTVRKQYVALLDGILKGAEKSGRIELRHRTDVEHRPLQILDNQDGKLAVTLWQNDGVVLWKNPLTGAQKKCTRVMFTPLTGRTHQLRVASRYALGLPIAGDSLYGSCEEGGRLLLHAQYISFLHPLSREPMEFFCKSDF